MTVAISRDRTRSNGDSPRTFGSKVAGAGVEEGEDIGDTSWARQVGVGAGEVRRADGVEPGPPLLRGGLALLGRGGRRGAGAVDLATGDLEAPARRAACRPRGGT